MIDFFLNFATTLYERFLELALTPINHLETLWMVIPILLTLFAMEIYFGRYKAEEMGWDSVFGNSLVLVFVSIDLVRFLYNQGGWMSFVYVNPKIALVTAVIIEGIALTMMGFYHILPKNIAFNISAALPMNLIAFFSILLIYTDIELDGYTLLASLGIMAVFVAIISVAKLLEPKYYDISGAEEKFVRAPSPRR